MAVLGIYINGIEVVTHKEGYMLKKDNQSMTCYANELNESIPEFEEFLQQALAKCN